MSAVHFWQFFVLGVLGLVFLAFWITYRIERACQIRKGKDHESDEPIVTRPRVKRHTTRGTK